MGLRLWWDNNFIFASDCRWIFYFFGLSLPVSYPLLCIGFRLPMSLLMRSGLRLPVSLNFVLASDWQWNPQLGLRLLMSHYFVLALDLQWTLYFVLPSDCQWALNFVLTSDCQWTFYFVLTSNCQWTIYFVMASDNQWALFFLLASDCQWALLLCYGLRLPVSHLLCFSFRLPISHLHFWPQIASEPLSTLFRPQIADELRLHHLDSRTRNANWPSTLFWSHIASKSSILFWLQILFSGKNKKTSRSFRLLKLLRARKMQSNRMKTKS